MTSSDDGEPQRGLFSWIRRIFRPSRPPIVPARDDLARKRQQVQVEVIQRAFDGQVAVAGGRGDAGVDFLYRPGAALVQTANVERVLAYFEEHQRTYSGMGGIVDEPLPGFLALLSLPPRRGDLDGNVDVLATLDELNRELGEVVASPDHILYVTGRGYGSLCPFTEPDLPPSSRPVPGPSTDPKAGADVRVSVVDTGWYAGAAGDSDTTWLETGVGGEDDPGISQGVINAYAGHGTFVTGVLRCLAPMAQVENEAIMVKGGAAFEADIVKQLNQAMLKKSKPQLISISAGTHTYQGAPLMSFVALSAIHKFGTKDEGPLVVAAAGNASTDLEFWPAAFDWVVAVGSLDADGKKSKFSNYGKWVDVWAQGSNLVNAFPTGRYTTYEPQTPAGIVRDFTGLATWSGTSFSTPIVTGAIAAYMSKHGVSARAARDALKQTAVPKQDPTAGTMKALGPPFM